MATATRTMKDFGPVRIGFMAAVALAVIAGGALLFARLSTPPLVPLFSNLSPEDSARISSKLEAMGMTYELQAGGSQIMVPVGKVPEARVQLAQSGLPATGATVGYEIFDKDEKLGVSGFVYNVNLVRALEGELARTIAAFDKVASARVHLVMPRQDLFARNKQQPSASVALQINGLSGPDRDEIDAIAHLVATAVPGLDVKRITIVDTKGRPLKRATESEDDPESLASSADDYRTKLENRLKTATEDLLSRSVGAGKVEVQVSAEVDLDRTITDQETYDPDSQAVRSTHATEQKDASENKEGQETSVATNLPASSPASSANGAKSNSLRNDTVTNYEVSKTIKKIIKGTGEIKRLSVAVLVDGIYTYNKDEDKYVYQPRPKEELDKLAELARGAVGFNEARGDTLKIVNMEFSKELPSETEEPPFAWLKRDIGGIIQTLTAGVVITLIIVLLIKPLIKKAFESGKDDEAEEAALRAALTEKEMEELNEIAGLDAGREPEEKKDDDWLNVDRLEDKSKDSSVAAINNIIEKHPREAAAVLRSWLERE